jgi:hypothetical protein
MNDDGYMSHGPLPSAQGINLLPNRITDDVFKDIAANRAKLEDAAKLGLESLNRQGIQLLTDLDGAYKIVFGRRDRT